MSFPGWVKSLTPVRLFATPWTAAHQAPPSMRFSKQLHFHFSLSCIGEGNGNPLQCSCLENPRDGGAWCVAIYGVAQSWTWLKRLSSSKEKSSRSSAYKSRLWSVWLDWLVFCDYGFSVSALCCPLATPTILLRFLLPWTWGISSQLLQQSSASAPYL